MTYARDVAVFKDAGKSSKLHPKTSRVPPEVKTAADGKNEERASTTVKHINHDNRASPAATVNLDGNNEDVKAMNVENEHNNAKDG